jgi:hypothetical protein
MDRKEFIFYDFVGFALCFWRLVSRFESGSRLAQNEFDSHIILLFVVSMVYTWTMSFATAARTDPILTSIDVWHLKKNFNVLLLKLGRCILNKNHNILFNCT